VWYAEGEWGGDTFRAFGRTKRDAISQMARALRYADQTGYYTQPAPPVDAMLVMLIEFQPGDALIDDRHV
jgi:hypothetical protein